MPNLTVIRHIRPQPWGYGHHPRGSRMQQRIHADITRPLISTQEKDRSSETNCVISQERGRSKPNRLLGHPTRKGLFLKTNKNANQNCRNRTQNASGSLEPCHNMWHGFTTRDSYRRILYHTKRGQAVLYKDIQAFCLLPWRLDPFCTMGDDPRQARSCSSEFCPSSLVDAVQPKTV